MKGNHTDRRGRGPHKGSRPRRLDEPVGGDGHLDDREPNLDELGRSQYECSLVRHDPRIPSAIVAAIPDRGPWANDPPVLSPAERLRFYEIGGQADDLADLDAAPGLSDVVFKYLRSIDRQVARNARTDEPATQKFCRACKSDRPVVEFTRDRNQCDGLAPLCRPCKRAYERERQRIWDRAGLPPRPSLRKRQP